MSALHNYDLLVCDGVRLGHAIDLDEDEVVVVWGSAPAVVEAVVAIPERMAIERVDYGDCHPVEVRDDCPACELAHVVLVGMS